MRYTLTMKNHDAKTIVILSYTMWSKVREAAGLLRDGIAEDFTYNVQIYDNETKQVVYNENTY